VAVLGRIWSAAEWPAGWVVHHVAETGSTNSDLIDAYERGLVGDRTVLATDHQTAGRGRLDRRWDAPPGSNLLVSIVFQTVPSVPVELTHRVGLAAVAAVRALVEAGRTDLGTDRVGLKWPNDVLVGDRKLAGVLAQRSARGAVVAGLGMNVRWAPDGAVRLGSAVSPAEVLAAMLGEYDALPVRIDELYRAELMTLGREVRVDLPGERSVVGRATDVDAVGRLVVHDACGTPHHFDVGDIVHARLT
jgi:BirA family biotin operon repressor/biotin-[acetyl-CoA-carboxylase] ligase